MPAFPRTVYPSAPSAFPPPSTFPAQSAFPPPSAFPPSPLYPSAQDLAGPRRAKRPIRTVGGVLWAAIAVICGAGGVLEFSVGIVAGGVLCLIIAVGAGWYDYRIWRPKKRRDPR